MKSLLFVIFWFPLSGLCTSQIVLTSGVRERDHCCFVFVFLKQIGIVCFIHITLYIYLTGNCWNSPVTCLSSDSVSITNLFVGDSHCQYIINPQYFSV